MRRMWTRGLLIGAATAGLFVASTGPASAYCRSTTCTGDCTVDENGCKTAGKPLYWDSSCVGFSLQEDGTVNIPMKHARPPLVASFVAWSDLECEGGGLADIAFSELAMVSCAKAEFNEDGANANIIIFQDNKWRYTGLDNNLAKTTVTFDEETGEILDADIEINHANNYFTVSDTDVEFDLQSVVTHEVGHFIGLDHTPDFDATMYAGYDRGSTELRTLEADDVSAVCAAYPPGRGAKCITDPKGGLGDACGGDVPAAAGDGDDEGGCNLSGRTPLGARSPQDHSSAGSPSGLPIAPLSLLVLAAAATMLRPRRYEPSRRHRP